jgi:hypothetical protein
MHRVRRCNRTRRSSRPFGVPKLADVFAATGSLDENLPLVSRFKEVLTFARGEAASITEKALLIVAAIKESLVVRESHAVFPSFPKAFRGTTGIAVILCIGFAL